MRIEVLDEAENDLVNGYAFYERQSQGLGQYFLDSLFADLESLHIYAGIHAMYLGYHRLLAKRFPFAIYYRLQDKVIRVYAILDCRRDPARIRNRLDN
jgi:hypothetical protein